MMPLMIPLPARGRLTFDAEGQEGGPFHSRRLHVPSLTSGLTIGRGYDMKLRSKSMVRDDFVAAGVDMAGAALISQAAGLLGERAEEFIEENDLEDFEILPETQLVLFETEYHRQLEDTRRLASKADVTRAYGGTDWEALHPAIVDVMVDLRFRGDYTPGTRRFLQVTVVNNDLAAFTREVANRDRWPRVPRDRYARRRRFCEEALG